MIIVYIAPVILRSATALAEADLRQLPRGVRRPAGLAENLGARRARAGLPDTGISPGHGLLLLRPGAGRLLR